jgi:hypothetical protein
MVLAAGVAGAAAPIVRPLGAPAPAPSFVFSFVNLLLLLLEERASRQAQRDV